MTSKEAERLQVGDKVHAFNGPYCQRGYFIRREKDNRGWWITFAWANYAKTVTTTTKRAKSVHVGWPEKEQEQRP